MTNDSGLFFVAWMLVAYVCGSVPFAYLIGKVHGVDIREIGSGNVGATNVARAVGRSWGVLCFSLDMLKGFIPVLAVGWLLGYVGKQPLEPSDAWQWLLVAAAPVVGHVYPIWLRFSGGKGAATGLGCVLAIWPWLTVPGFGCIMLWSITLALFRYVSLASVVAAVALPLLVALRSGVRDPLPSVVVPFVIVTGALASLVVLRHRENLARLRTGTEPKMGRP